MIARMGTPSFDEQVKALRGKVEPRSFHGKKSDATPDQWAAHLDYSREVGRRWYHGSAENRQRTLDATASYRRTGRGRATQLKAKKRYRQGGKYPAARERNRVRMKEYRATPTGAAVARASKRLWRERKLASDPAYRLSVSLRARLFQAIRGGYKSGSAVRDLGCSIEELKVHIERQFTPGMSWGNWGTGPGTWQIDHIYPLAKTELTDRPQLLAACNWRNLQPLWYEDNLRKGDTVTPDAQALFDRLRGEFSRAGAA
jgi:hypothetical protein